MNILFLVGTIAGGGAERVAVELANEWSKTRNIYIYLSEGRSANDYFLSERVNLIVSQSRGLLAQVFEVRRLKKELGIDFALSFSTYNGVINAFSKQNEKTVNGIHAVLSLEQNFLKKMAVIVDSKMVDLIAPVSNASARDLVRNYGVTQQKIRPMYNPCNLDEVSVKVEEKVDNERVKHLIKSRRRIIITHGRLSKEKCQARMIRAMRGVVKSHDDVVLLIMGVGPLENYLKELIVKYNLEDNIYLLGFQTNPFKYLNLAEIYIFSSAHEGFPIAPLDAMAVGLPIVAAQGLTGVRELIAPETDCEYQTTGVEYADYGVLTPSFDFDLPSAEEDLLKSEQLFQQAICEMLDSKELREQYSRKSLERIKDFAPERIVEQWEELIATL